MRYKHICCDECKKKLFEDDKVYFLFNEETEDTFFRGNYNYCSPSCLINHRMRNPFDEEEKRIVINNLIVNGSAICSYSLFYEDVLNR